MQQHPHPRRQRLITWLVGSLAGLSLLCAGTAQAALLTFTDPTAFLNMLSSGPFSTLQTLNFEPPSAQAGDTVLSGGTLGGLTFTFNFGGLNLLVDAQFQTTSGNNYLTLDDGVNSLFASGDALTFGLSGVAQALGVFVIGTPGDVRAGDFALQVSAGSVSNSATPNLILADGGEAFFLGLIEDNAALGFTQATLASFGLTTDPTFFWSLDDVSTSLAPATVPEPGTWLLLVTGALGLVAWRRRRAA